MRPQAQIKSDHFCRKPRFRQKFRSRSERANPAIFDYIEGDDTVFEREPLERLAEEGELMSYQHEGFWQCMDTLREKRVLERIWASGEAPWKKW